MALTKYNIDAASAVRAQKALADAQKGYNEELDQSSKRLTKAERLARKLAEQADPQKEYNRRLNELAGAANRGEVGLDDASIAAARLQKRLDGVNRVSEKSFGGAAIARLGTYAASALSISTAISLINKELAFQQQLADRRVETQVTLNQSRSVLRRNLGDKSDAEISQIQNVANAISSETNISEKFINIALADAISASGGDVKASIQAVRSAALFSPDSPYDISQIAGTFLDLSKVTGTNDGLSNLGYLSAVGAAGRVVDARLQATNIAPGIIGTLAFGGDAQTSGSLFASISNATADLTGAKTGTTIIQLARQIEEFDKANESFDAPDLRGRIEALRANKELAKQFLDKASFEGKAVGVVRQLFLDSNSEASRLYLQNLQQFPQLEELASRGQRAIDALDVANPLRKTAARQRAFGVAAEGIQKQNLSNTLSSNEIEDVRTILGELGSSALGTDAEVYINRLNGDGITTDEVQRSLRGRANRLRTRQSNATIALGIDGLPLNDVTGGVGGLPEDILIAEKLDLVAERLDQLIFATERSVESQEQLRQVNEQLTDGI